MKASEVVVGRSYRDPRLGVVTVECEYRPVPGWFEARDADGVAWIVAAELLSPVEPPAQQASAGFDAKSWTSAPVVTVGAGSATQPAHGTGDGVFGDALDLLNGRGSRKSRDADLSSLVPAFRAPPDPVPPSVPPPPPAFVPGMRCRVRASSPHTGIVGQVVTVVRIEDDARWVVFESGDGGRYCSLPSNLEPSIVEGRAYRLTPNVYPVGMLVSAVAPAAVYRNMWWVDPRGGGPRFTVRDTDVVPVDASADVPAEKVGSTFASGCGGTSPAPSASPTTVVPGLPDDAVRMVNCGYRLGAGGALEWSAEWDRDPVPASAAPLPTVAAADATGDDSGSFVFCLECLDVTRLDAGWAACGHCDWTTVGKLVVTALRRVDDDRRLVAVASRCRDAALLRPGPVREALDEFGIVARLRVGRALAGIGVLSVEHFALLAEEGRSMQGAAREADRFGEPSRAPAGSREHRCPNCGERVTYHGGRADGRVACNACGRTVAHV